MWSMVAVGWVDKKVEHVRVFETEEQAKNFIKKQLSPTARETAKIWEL